MKIHHRDTENTEVFLPNREMLIGQNKLRPSALLVFVVEFSGSPGLKKPFQKLIFSLA
jgi:hypothetical protein